MLTLLVNIALPLEAQGEEKVTVCDVLTGDPPLDTVTLTLVVPNAESGLVPKAGAVMVTAAAPTEKPIDPVIVVPCTRPVAVRVVAPEAERLAGLKVMVATPEALVSAVLAGLIVAKVVSVLKVITVLGTGAPLASNTVALTVAGALLEMEVTVTPEALVSAMVRLEETVVVLVVDVVPVCGPLPQPVKAISVVANSKVENFAIGRTENFCTRASLCLRYARSNKAIVRDDTTIFL